MAGADTRNIALVGHGGAGKTTLTEAILFATKMVSRQGTIGDKNTVSDFADDEKERGHSIDCTVLHGDWKGKHLNVLDTPGYPDFVGQALRCLDVVDCALIGHELQRLRLNASEHRSTAALRNIGVRFLADDVFIAPAAMTKQSAEVRLSSTRQEKRRLGSQSLGCDFLKPIDGGIIAVHVISDLRCSHRLAHRHRWTSNGVTSQVDDVNCGYVFGH